MVSLALPALSASRCRALDRPAIPMVGTAEPFRPAGGVAFSPDENWNIRLNINDLHLCTVVVPTGVYSSHRTSDRKIGLRTLYLFRKKNYPARTGERLPLGKPWYSHRISGKRRRKFETLPGLQRLPGGGVNNTEIGRASCR